MQLDMSTLTVLVPSEPILTPLLTTKGKHGPDRELQQIELLKSSYTTELPISEERWDRLRHDMGAPPTHRCEMPL
jgi:hypothetical protein